MKKLASISEELKAEELLNEIDISEIKGGRRYVTTSYAMALQVVYTLKAYGYRYYMSKHGGEYCVEW